MNHLIVNKNIIKTYDFYYNKIFKEIHCLNINKKSISNIINTLKNNLNDEDFLNISSKILFFICAMIDNNDITNPIDYKLYGTKPRGGFEFINKKTDEGLGIYHAHISEDDKGVLIWYNIWTNKGISIYFEYISPHPNDYYKSIIKRLYETNNIIHIIRYQYLVDLKYLLNENLYFMYFKQFEKYFENKLKNY